MRRTAEVQARLNALKPDIHLLLHPLASQVVAMQTVNISSQTVKVLPYPNELPALVGQGSKWHCACSNFAVPGKSEIRERTEQAREQEDRQDLMDSIHQIRDALVYLAAREKAREASEIALQTPVPRDPPQPAN